MKKRAKVKKYIKAGVCIAAGALSAALCGCNGLVPYNESHYYYIDGVCRTISLDLSKTRTLADVPLQACFVKPRVAQNVFESIYFTEYGVELFASNSVLFKDKNVLNFEGVLAVYGCLGITDYTVSDELTDCLYTDFYSYNIKEKWNMKYKFDGLESDEVQHGQIADVTVFTFKYEDLDPNGSVISKGAFEVYVSSYSYVGEFEYISRV